MPCTAKHSRTLWRGAGRFLIISGFCLLLVSLWAISTPAQITDPPNLALTQQFGGFVQPSFVSPFTSPTPVTAAGGCSLANSREGFGSR